MAIFFNDELKKLSCPKCGNTLLVREKLAAYSIHEKDNTKYVEYPVKEILRCGKCSHVVRERALEKTECIV